MIRFYLGIFLICILCSCSKNNNGNNYEAIIGISFGECAGDCVTLYKLNEGAIFPDTEGGYFTSNPSFSDTALIIPDNLVSRFEEIVSNTPSLLLDNSESVYGTPDAGDWGSIHFFNSEREWTLDNSNRNNPEEIQDFVMEIQDLIDELGG